MNFNFSEVVSEQPKKLFSTELTVLSTVSDAESGGVKKILAVSAEPRILSAEYSDGGIKTMGRVNFKMFYIDAEDHLKNLDYFNDFTNFVPSEDLSGQRIAVFHSSVEVSAKTDLTVKLGARIILDFYASEKNQVQGLVNPPDGVYSEYACGKVSKFAAFLEQSATFDDEQETRSAVDGIMMYENSVVLTDVKTSDGSFKVTGKIVSTVCYLSGDDIKKIEFDVPFDEEYLNSSVCSGQTAFGFAEVKTARIILGGDDKKNVIKSEITLNFNFWTYETEEIKYVRDLYSAKLELTPETCALKTGTALAAERFDRKVSGSVTLSDDFSAIRQTVEVLGVRNNVAKVSVIRSSDDENDCVKYRIEGIIEANVVYTDENGLNSVAAEIPYSETFDSKNRGNVVPIAFSGIAENAFARVKGDRKIEVTAEAVFAVSSVKTDELDLICKVTEGEARPQNESAFSVYIAEEGDGVWEVAKAMTARPDEITAQNPELVFPLKAGDRAVIYRKLDENE